MTSVIVEAVAGTVCEMAIEMAVKKLAEEASVVVNFRKDFIWLNNQLTYVTGFLQDAAQQAQQNEAVKQWLGNIRNIALRAEDICEECAVESMYGHNAQSCGFSCNHLVFLYKMGRKIKDIKERIRSIIAEGNELKLVREVLSVNQALPSTSGSVDCKRSDLFPSDSHPVGIESKVDDMLSLLDNPAFPIIAVVGMGGLGRTYLLQHLYNIIRQRYEKSIWLSVSQSYSISNLQKDLAFHLDLSEQIKGSEISKEQMAGLIHGKLQEKRYLVVLDDVWRASREDDLLAKLGLPTGKDSLCKIVVTTRSKDVCRNLDAEMYEMKYLTEEESWSLFSFYAFRGGREKTEQLEGVGREIVKECGNLPLAIKTTGASLANTTIPWESKLRQLKGALSVTANLGSDPILPALRLSYDSLPTHLKECFAYLSFFPEDEKIDCEYLIYLWIGEGFIPAGEEQWDMAWDCLYQLSNLCMLQVWEGLKDGCLTKYCKIHDLLLDLAIQISRENKCAFSIEEACTHTSAGNGSCRILLSKKAVDINVMSNSNLVCLRTLSLSQSWIDSKHIPSKLFTGMRGLRVLDLSSTGISSLPESVGTLKLLKVLNLRGTAVGELPECMRHLKRLVFLDLYMTLCPMWIGELQFLQHFECNNIGPNFMPKEISRVASLRTLGSGMGWLEFSIEEDNFLTLEDLGSMVTT